MIAEAAASVPWLLYDGDEELSDHPLLGLLNRPNPFQSGRSVMEAFYGHLQVAGDSYLEAVAADGRVGELHVLRPDRMKVVPGPDGWPQAYEYTANGQSVRFDQDGGGPVPPILHLKLFNPADDYYGLSPLDPAAKAVDVHSAASAWNKALPATPSRQGSYRAPTIFGPAEYELLDLPYLPTASDGFSSWIAAAGQPWPGELAVVAGEPDETQRTIAGIVVPAVIGVTATGLTAGPLWRIDRGNVLDVDVLSGGLASVSDLALLNGANAAAVGSAASGWEIVQFRDAELVAPGRYRLSMLLRGQAGSEPEMLASRPAGSEFVLLDQAVTELAWQADDIGVPVTLRIGPASLDTADPAYRTTS
jgi:hypothetical protein